MAAVLTCIAAAGTETVKVYVNGNEVVFDEALPFINEADRVMIPLFFVGQSLGAEVLWEKENKNTVSVIRQGHEITLVIGEKQAAYDGNIIELDSEALLKNSRTYVPLRFIAEAMECDVNWSGQENAVYINTAPKTGTNRERKLNNDAVSMDVEEVNVLDFGADPSGVKDCTSDIRRAHNTGKRVYYPNGTYIFNGKSLSFAGGVRFESQDGVLIRNSIAEQPVISFDDFGNLIGLAQNHLESYKREQRDFMDVGSLVPPPLSNADYETKVDFIPCWYNDFGLESTRLAQYGSMTWYYWLWNYHSAGLNEDDPRMRYSPERHPLLGYYKGDDPIVLDWISYWLREYGAKAVLLYSTPKDNVGMAAGWASEASPDHWIYQLFHNVPNFKGLKYILTLNAKYPPGDAAIDQNVINGVKGDWFNTIKDVYLKYDNVYCMVEDGKRYPVVYIHETKALPGVFDAYKSFDNTAKFFVEVADLFKEGGYDGVAFFCRHPDDKMYPHRQWLKENGVLFYDADYSGTYGTGETYADLVKNFNPPVKKETIINTATGHYTVGPHPSKWNIKGETPELFEQMLVKAVEHIEKNQLPKVITCYNVSEWSEGGPGLIPNMKNRFAYLDAVKNAIVK
jgi:hypothetical protein